MYGFYEAIQFYSLMRVILLCSVICLTTSFIAFGSLRRIKYNCYRMVAISLLPVGNNITPTQEGI